ncbi:4,5-DOPA dioxygenase extradiol [Ferrovum sp. PN-J185]|uniref:4,5-DOPA-extradiol-dioxygenase n=1 Tax=Ferrovum sp. PN-J185 TaxID=1356306 RepID=UPI00079975E8|nr:4,5-DOPA dioxygenase extradiol [Ferrovum sp. PN-J185]KXW56806.1 LigB family dioxygenase [Ferrovum sp. PN-J185]MCC6067701.1 4,5-DOPA dioxygenase extradiol [Ferrovum sp. PN-J185]MDE1891373.1 4,5-DOPA dioxygenase extradiol [Betaproteobacteria bacterium]
MKNNVYFFGHGNPIFALQPNRYTQSWQKAVSDNPRPDSIVCISAHWMTPHLSVTSMENPKTIHDFSGFPKELYEINYPVKGNPLLAQQIVDILKQDHCVKDYDWGIDHGSWSVLKYIYPDASIPTIQISLNRGQGLLFHYELGKKLSVLRDQNILIVASGNTVHNLYEANWRDNTNPDPRALEFDKLLKEKLFNRDKNSFVNLLADYPNLSKWAHPSIEHLLPLCVAFGASDEKDKLSIVCEGIDMSSISMTSLAWKV